MFSEDQLVPISALQHLLFCERQCALIHIENAWAENRLTVEGKHLHQKVHEAGAESRGDVRIARGVRLRSLRLGLTGVADVMEFHRQSDHGAKGFAPSKGTNAPLEGGKPPALSAVEGLPPLERDGGVALEGVEGLWTPFPVEYKRGRPKSEPWDEVQLCAQALCLEEMLAASIEAGALFYGATRRRQDVAFDAALRRLTEETAGHLRRLLDAGTTPRAQYAKKCENCSLLPLCMPETAGKGKSAKDYLRRAVDERIRLEGGGPPPP